MQVLVIAPHADDEVLGTAGAIQWHKAKGDTVAVAVIADRVLDHKPDKNYTAQTKKNAEKVRQLLGITRYFFCNLKDEHLDESLIKVITAIEKVVDRLKPDIVFIPGETDRHQDHRAVYQACRVACRDIDKVLMYELPSSSKYFEPNYYIEITAEFMNNKIKAFKCYDSEIREYPNPRSVDGLKLRAQIRGMECHRKLAEAFILFREVI